MTCESARTTRAVTFRARAFSSTATRGGAGSAGCVGGASKGAVREVAPEWRSAFNSSARVAIAGQMLRCCNDFDRLQPRERRPGRPVQTHGVSQVRCVGGTSPCRIPTDRVSSGTGRLGRTRSPREVSETSRRRRPGRLRRNEFPERASLSRCPGSRRETLDIRV